MSLLGLIVSAAGIIFAAQSARAPDPVPAVPRTIYREVFDYDPEGRRDPFSSLLGTAEIRPLLTDLRVTSILHDPSGRNSVAVLRDLTTREQYRVKVGQTLGRLRVRAIEQKSITFVIEEFGFSRQETLVIGDTTRTRIQ